MSTVKVDTIQTTGGASELAIDKLKGVSSASSISVVAEGGTTTTDLQQGVAKCWGNLDGDAGTAVFFDSFNLSGITDNGTGNYTFAINNDMASTSYTLQMSSNMGGGSGGFNGAGNITAGTYQFYGYTQGGSFRDLATAYSTVHGALA